MGHIVMAEITKSAVFLFSCVQQLASKVSLLSACLGVFPCLLYTNPVYANAVHTDPVYINSVYTNSVYTNFVYTNSMFTNSEHTNPVYTNPVIDANLPDSKPEILLQDDKQEELLIV